jgi:hypothetical protein
VDDISRTDDITNAAASAFFDFNMLDHFALSAASRIF